MRFMAIWIGLILVIEAVAKVPPLFTPHWFLMTVGLALVVLPIDGSLERLERRRDKA